MPPLQSPTNLSQTPPATLPVEQDSEELIEVLPEMDFNLSNFVIPIKLTDTIEEKVKKIFREEMQTIHAERSAMYNGKGFDQQCKDNIDLYNGIVEPPNFTWSSANYHIWFPTMMVDIATILSKEQTMTNPIMKFECDDEIKAGEKKNDLADRENKHDFKLKTKVKVEDLIDPFYKNTYIQGTAFVEVPMVNDTEWARYKKTYYLSEAEQTQYKKDKADAGDIIQFKKDFPEYKDNTKQSENLATLISDGMVTAEVIKRLKKYYGAKPRRIPIEKFWARPSIKDLSRQRMYADERDFTWNDIEKLSGYYFKSQVEKLKADAGADYYKADYTVFKCRIFCDLFDDGKLMRFMATIDKKSETILRLEYYPYQHWQPDVVAFYIMPKDDCLYGDGFMMRSKDSSMMMDNSWNTIYDTFVWALNPIIETDDENLDFSARDWSPLSVIHHKKDTKVGVLKLTYPQLETLNITTMTQRFGEMGTGISAGMSGAETPSDPNAPGNKTAMLLGEAYKRLKDYTRELLKSLQTVSELVEQVDLQFNPDEHKYLTDGYIKEINRQIYNKKVRHTALGLTLSINKQDDLAKIVGFINLFIAYYPEKMQDPTIRYEILRAIIENTGGTIERLKKILNPSPEEEQANKLKEVLKQFAEAVANGDETAIAQFQQMVAGSEQQAPEQAPAPVEPTPIVEGQPNV